MYHTETGCEYRRGTELPQDRVHFGVSDVESLYYTTIMLVILLLLKSPSIDYYNIFSRQRSTVSKLDVTNGSVGRS